MGFKAGDRMLAELRKYAPVAFRNSLYSKQQTRFDAVTVDVNSLIFSLVSRCETGRDLLARFQAMVAQHVDAGARASTFCLDERWLVPECKGVEWRRREASSTDQGKTAYAEFVELAAPLSARAVGSQLDSVIDGDIDLIAQYESDDEGAGAGAGATKTQTTASTATTGAFGLAAGG